MRPARYLLLALVFGAYAAPAAAQATTGSLQLNVDGLPLAAEADVTVSGPGGFSRTLTRPATLTNLAPGTYTVEAGTVRHGCTEYDVSLDAASVSVTAGAAATVTATHTDPWPGPQQLGSAAIDEGRAVTFDADCNIWVTGFTHSGLDGHPAGESSDAFVVKYDVRGTKLWSRQIDGGETAGDYGYDLAPAPDGGAYLLADVHGDPDGNPDTWLYPTLFRLDASGATVWATQFAETFTVAWALAADAGGNVYVAGGSREQDGAQAVGGSDALLMKFAGTGERLWARLLGTSENDAAFDVAVDRGSVYLTGQTWGALGGTHGGGSDLFVAKFSDAGALQWVQQAGGAGEEAGAGVTIGPAGDVYVAGAVDGSFDGHAHGGNHDPILVKYDANGTQLWSWQSGSNVNEWSRYVRTDAAGNVYLLASVQENSSLGGTPLGFDDLALLQFAPDGTLQASTRIGTAAGDDISTVSLFGGGGGFALDAVGTALVAGATHGAFDGFTNAGNRDFFLTRARFFRPTSTSAEAGELPLAFHLDGNYPNPFNPTTTIRYRVDRPGLVRVAVYSVLGRELAVLAERHHAAGSYEARFDAQGLPSGLYLYRLEAHAQTQTRTMTLLR